MREMGKITVILSDWQVLFREGIHFTLSGEEDIEVTGEATSGGEAFSLIESNPPRVAILNADNDQPSGVEVTRRIKQNLPGVSVILIMDSDNEEQLFSAMKSGASAAITKDIDPNDLINLIDDVAKGGHPIHQALWRPGISARVLAEFETFSLISQQVGGLLTHLAPSEAEILNRIAGGSSKELAGTLGITEEAINRQLALILHKLIVNDHDREVIEAVRGGLFPISKPESAEKPAEYVTKEEFATFKGRLLERFKTIGEAS
jgi:DNA-binding NarL/FixJ family response regulator